MSSSNVSLSRRDVSVRILGAGIIGLMLAVIAGCQQATTEPAVEATGSDSDTVEEAAVKTRLPKLLDLGAGGCIPCKKMEPILDELRDKYAGKLEVEYIDVWQNPRASMQYGIGQLPTQIFFDASGKELFRHAGFFSKGDILKAWQECGVDLIE